jgi:hypothetical protein
MNDATANMWSAKGEKREAAMKGFIEVLAVGDTAISDQASF